MGRLDDLKPVGRNPDTLLAWERQRLSIIINSREIAIAAMPGSAYEMIDADIVCTSPSTVYRVLSKAGLLMRWGTRKRVG
jgi:hypothetical protein